MPSAYVVVNARAGGCKPDVESDLRHRFAAKGIDARVVTLSEGEGFESALRAASSAGSIAIAAGGDGTINAVASVIAGTRCALGVVPLGTLNHFAKDLGIPLDVDKAIDAIATGRSIRVDVGTVNDRVFVNNSSIGLYPSIVQRRERHQAEGRRKYPALIRAAFEALRTQHRLLVQVAADRNQPSDVWRTPFVMVGNNPYDVAGLRIAGRTRLDRGMLVAYIAPRVRVRDLPLSLLKSWVGRTFQHPAKGPEEFRTMQGGNLRVTIHGRSVVDVALDGEVVRLTQPLCYRSRPGALTVLVPSK